MAVLVVVCFLYVFLMAVSVEVMALCQGNATNCFAFLMFLREIDNLNALSASFHYETTNWIWGKSHLFKVFEKISDKKEDQDFLAKFIATPCVVSSTNQTWSMDTNSCPYTKNSEIFAPFSLSWIENCSVEEGEFVVILFFARWYSELLFPWCGS